MKFSSLIKRQRHWLRPAATEGQIPTAPSPQQSLHAAWESKIQWKWQVTLLFQAPLHFLFHPAWVVIFPWKNAKRSVGLTGSSCSSGSLDASKGWRCATGKTTLFGRLFSRLPPLVSHLPGFYHVSGDQWLKKPSSESHGPQSASLASDTSKFTLVYTGALVVVLQIPSQPECRSGNKLWYSNTNNGLK